MFSVGEERARELVKVQAIEKNDGIVWYVTYTHRVSCHLWRVSSATNIKQPPHTNWQHIFVSGVTSAVFRW